ncbi:MAG: rhomboid family intramembrane serine protease [Bacteroidota bacterium]
MAYEQYRPTGFKLLPPVVKNLLIINGLFFLASITVGQAFQIDLSDVLGLHYFAADKFKPYQLITYMFMHANFSHIFFNMFALWMFGYVLENVWGPKRFLIYYFVTGIGAALIQYIVIYFELRPVLEAVNVYLSHPSHEQLTVLLNSGKIDGSYEPLKLFIQHYNSIVNTNMTGALNLSTDFVNQYKVDLLNAPTVVGASGAVFGILLAFGMMFPNSLIYIYFAIPVKAKWVVLGYGLLELGSGIYGAAGDNVAHFAHLGGMLFGFVLIKIWQRKAKRNNFYGQQ